MTVQNKNIDEMATWLNRYEWQKLDEWLMVSINSFSADHDYDSLSVVKMVGQRLMIHHSIQEVIQGVQTSFECRSSAIDVCNELIGIAEFAMDILGDNIRFDYHCNVDEVDLTSASPELASYCADFDCMRRIHDQLVELIR